MSELVEWLQEEQQFHHEQIARLRQMIVEAEAQIDYHTIALHSIITTYYDLPKEEQL